MRVEVGLPQLRRGRYQPDLLGLPDGPFTWKPAFVRRSLGISGTPGLCRRTVPRPGGRRRARLPIRRSRTGDARDGAPSTGSRGSPGSDPVAVRRSWPRPSPGPHRCGPPSTGSARPRVRSSVRQTTGGRVPRLAAVRLRGRSEAKVTVAGPDGRPGGATTLLSVVRRSPGRRMARRARLPGPGRRAGVPVAGRAGPGGRALAGVGLTCSRWTSTRGRWTGRSTASSTPSPSSPTSAGRGRRRAHAPPDPRRPADATCGPQTRVVGQNRARPPALSGLPAAVSGISSTSSSCRGTL